MGSIKVALKLALGAAFIVMLGFFLAPYFTGDKPLDPVMVQLGWTTIYWYGFLIVVSIVAGFLLAAGYLAPRFSLSFEHLLNITIWALAGGLVGARIVFVILKWPIYAGNLSEIWLFPHGGLSIHGAVLFGALAILIYTRFTKLNFWKIGDMIAPALILGQAIGRFGNFVNQEAFGGPTDLPWKMFVAPEFRPAGLEDFVYFHPTFLYESIFALGILVVLLSLIKRKLPAGYVMATYLILYSSLRFIVEFFRIDSDTWGVLTVAQWASLALIILGAYILYKRRHA